MEGPGKDVDWFRCVGYVQIPRALVIDGLTCGAGCPNCIRTHLKGHGLALRDKKSVVGLPQNFVGVRLSHVFPRKADSSELNAFAGLVVQLGSRCCCFERLAILILDFVVEH